MTILSSTLAILMAAVAHAQVVVVDPPKERSFVVMGPRWGYSGWGGYGVGGYSYGGYGGYSYGGYGGYGISGFSYGSPGYGYGYYQGPVGVDGLGYGYGSLYGGPGYYYRGYGARSGYFSRPGAAADAAGPLARTGPVADRMAEFTSAREIEEGRARLKAGDYRGAVDEFRSAVAAHTENPIAQAWFAVALAIVGDGRNADKALRAAEAGGFPVDRLALLDGFRDEKERAKVISSLDRASGDGALAAAFALSLAGEGAKLKKLAEKDPVARRLLPKP